MNDDLEVTTEMIEAAREALGFKKYPTERHGEDDERIRRALSAALEARARHRHHH